MVLAFCSPWYLTANDPCLSKIVVLSGPGLMILKVFQDCRLRVLRSGGITNPERIRS